MTVKQQGGSESSAMDETNVVEFLRETPDFFTRHLDLVADLQVPHPSGNGVVSLIERQVASLRGEKEALHGRLKSLAQAAKTNEQLLLRMQSLFVRLIDCADIDAALAVLDESLRDEFHADQVAVRLFDNEDVDLDTVLDIFEPVLSTCEPACGYMPPDQASFLFGSTACDVASGAVVPLHDGDGGNCTGLLAVASVDPKRFNAEMGTLFLNHLGVVVGSVLKAFAR